MAAHTDMGMTRTLAGSSAAQDIEGGDLQTGEGSGADQRARSGSEALRDVLRQALGGHARIKDDQDARRADYGDDYKNVVATAEVLHDTELTFLQRFPIGFFGIPLGVCSQTMLWKAIMKPGLPIPWDTWRPMQEGFVLIWWILGLVIFLAVLVTYIAKAITNRSIVLKEMNHPARVNLLFAPNLATIFLLLGVPPAVENAQAIEIMFWVCSFYQTALAVYLYSDWLFEGDTRGLGKGKSSTALLMSIVGWFVLASLSGRANAPEAGRIDFAIGVAFLAIVYVILWKTASDSASTVRRSPPMFLFIAPPSAASMAYLGLEGSFSGLGLGLFALALFMYTLLIKLMPKFVETSFSVTWWSFTFPSTAFAIAAINWAFAYDRAFTRLIAFSSTVLALGLVAVCTVRTLSVLRKGKLFRDGLAVIWREEDKQRYAARAASDGGIDG